MWIFLLFFFSVPEMVNKVEYICKQEAQLSQTVRTTLFVSNFTLCFTGYDS